MAGAAGEAEAGASAPSTDASPNATPFFFLGLEGTLLGCKKGGEESVMRLSRPPSLSLAAAIHTSAFCSVSLSQSPLSLSLSVCVCVCVYVFLYPGLTRPYLLFLLHLHRASLSAGGARRPRTQTDSTLGGRGGVCGNEVDVSLHSRCLLYGLGSLFRLSLSLSLSRFLHQAAASLLSTRKTNIHTTLSLSLSLSVDNAHHARPPRPCPWPRHGPTGSTGRSQRAAPRARHGASLPAGRGGQGKAREGGTKGERECKAA